MNNKQIQLALAKAGAPSPEAKNFDRWLVMRLLRTDGTHYDESNDDKSDRLRLRPVLLEALASSENPLCNRICVWAQTSWHLEWLTENIAVEIDGMIQGEA